MEPKNSKFALLEFLVQESYIKRKAVPQQGELEIKIKPSGLITAEQELFQLDLDITITEPGSERVLINVHAVGIFRFEEKVSQDTIPTYFTINAPAIIFPYVRAYIATLTAISGMEAITIPVLNLTGIQNELKENIEIAVK